LDLEAVADILEEIVYPIIKSHSQTAKDSAMRKLQALIKAILLRRNKKSTIDGKPILSLPDRVVEVQHSVFSKDEQEFYQALESQVQLQFNKVSGENLIYDKALRSISISNLVLLEGITPMHWFFFYVFVKHAATPSLSETLRKLHQD
jgi:SNF2 family DNA or RNA helicase